MCEAPRSFVIEYTLTDRGIYRIIIEAMSADDAIKAVETGAVDYGRGVEIRSLGREISSVRDCTKD